MLSIAKKILMLLVILLINACGAAQKKEQGSAADQGAQAEQLLEQARLKAVGQQAAVIVLLHADWCQPCNELIFRVMDTREGKALVDGNVYLALDFDEPLGAAVAKKLRVVGLPTTLVLRPGNSGMLEEFARIEGFEHPEEYQSALKQAISRTNPMPLGCENADDRPLELTRPPPLLMTDLECVAMQLTTDAGEDAAIALHAFLDDANTRAKLAKWPADLRQRVVALVMALGRYDSRVAQQNERAATLFAAMETWPGVEPKDLNSLVFWHARCLAKAGQGEAAEKVLDAHIAADNGSATARLLAADLMVHEHLAPERAKRLLADYLAAEPNDHWAHYLAGELATQQGDREAARLHLQAANRLKPGVALYIRHYLRVSGDTTQKP